MFHGRLLDREDYLVQYLLKLTFFLGFRSRVLCEHLFHSEDKSDCVCFLLCGCFLKEIFHFFLDVAV